MVNPFWKKSPSNQVFFGAAMCHKSINKGMSNVYIQLYMYIYILIWCVYVPGLLIVTWIYASPCLTHFVGFAKVLNPRRKITFEHFFDISRLENQTQFFRAFFSANSIARIHKTRAHIHKRARKTTTGSLLTGSQWLRPCFERSFWVWTFSGTCYPKIIVPTI